MTVGWMQTAAKAFAWLVVACFVSNLRAILSVLLFALPCLAQGPVSIDVDQSKSVGKFTPIYSWFGYDEPVTRSPKMGGRCLGQLHDLSPVPVYIRAHFLLATGDGKPDLKWSSSNVYTEDAQGNPVYSWTIHGSHSDANAAARVRPMVELAFMPKALSTHPRLARRHSGGQLKPGEVEGWLFPPKDYKRWQELNRQVAAHMVKAMAWRRSPPGTGRCGGEPDGKDTSPERDRGRIQQALRLRGRRSATGDS